MSLIQKSFKRPHYPTDIIAQSVRWYLAYSLILRYLEVMMVERGITVDHSTLHRWIIQLVPCWLRCFAGINTLWGAGGEWMTLT